MTDDQPAAGPPRRRKSKPSAGFLWSTPRGPAARLVLLALFFSLFGARPPGAHETIDIDRANALLAAAEEASARTKTVAGPGPEGEARFALGAVLVEVTDVLNRDLAAHSGHLEVNAALLQEALAARDLAPRFDEVIGRYRTPRAPLEEALRLSPEAAFAEAYPESMRAAATGVILKSLVGAQ
jgi:hypothetical protein